MAVAMDCETGGLAIGSTVNVVSLHDSRCERGAASFVRAPDDAERHLLEALLACESGARCLVTFNGTAFDFRQIAAGVVQRADARRASRLALTSYDLMLDFAADTGYMSSLDSFAGATLGERKTADGEAAVRLWNAGDHLAVQKYCENDARITCALHEHGVAYGFLERHTRAGKLARWALRPGLFRVATEALATHAASPPDNGWMTDPPDVASMADWVIEFLQ